jgi:integrase
MASLIQQHGYYYLQFYSNARSPKRKRVPLKVRVKRDAQAIRLKLERDYSLGEFDPWTDDPLTYDRVIVRPERLDAAVAAFLQSKSHLRPSTQKQYREVIDRFVTHAGPESMVSHVAAEDVERWLDSTKAGDVTRHNYVRHLKAFFRWARAEGIASAVATEGVRLRRIPTKFPAYLTPAEVDRIVRTIHEKARSAHWLADVVLFAVHTGLRRGELINLLWDHVSREDRLLVVANTESFTTKSATERKVPLSGVAVEVLERRAKSSASGYVFTHRNGRIRPDYLSEAFKRYAVKAGVRGVRLHHLRHTACSWLAQRGVPVEAIRRFAGHSSISVTEKYMHLSDNVYAQQVTAALNEAG